MTDIRILGSSGSAEQLEALSWSESAKRWLLCSRDFLRTASLVSATTPGEGKVISAAYPATNLFDGNRQTMMVTSDNCEKVTVTLDTGDAGRKALLWIEYPENEEIFPYKVSMAPEVGGTLSQVTLTALYRGRNFALWRFDFGAVVAQNANSVSSAISGTVYQLSTGSGEANDYWVGGLMVPQNGPYLGIPQTITDWNESSKQVTVASPWPVNLTAGTTVYLQKLRSSYLGHPVISIELISRWHPAAGPIRCIGLSVFDYQMELKGDMGIWRPFRAPNPTSVKRNATVYGAVHELLNGSVRIEQRNGPKRMMQAEWPAVTSSYADFVEAWAAQGIVGIVDETARFQQGIVSGLDWDGLPRAMNAPFAESSVRFSFREI